MNVLVVYGGESDEHDVSVASGEDVLASLRSSGDIDVTAALIDRDGRWHRTGEGTSAGAAARDVLDDLEPGTVIFPVLHGGWGEGGGLQREVEHRDLGLVGCGSDAAATALSKLQTQRVWAQAGLDVIPTLPVARTEFAADAAAVVRRVRQALPGDIVVKPDSGGSSIGVHMVSAGDEPLPALADVLARDETALVQPRVIGREVSIGVWQDATGTPRATAASLLQLPADAEAGGFTYAHKYEGAGGVLLIPAGLPQLAALQRAALQAFDALGCRDLARVDFFVTSDGAFVLNEINTMPGLRRASHFPRLVAAAGIDYDTLLRSLVAAALVRDSARLT
ncbi:D-alanine--D-alanine ligase family protein [Microbacterium protaetiae]|uniref:D-alanine--D-alanine ligase family protein n=1 Tax=Microbacterium protaetiae TaxID=2509458 RepID=UPI0013E9B593|nr:D-alanine--D-alanine ligase [Microbacterium protaetiae]